MVLEKMGLAVDSAPKQTTGEHIIADRSRAIVELTPYLERCGYRGPLLRADFCFGKGLQVPLAAFAHEPADALSACIAVAQGNGDPARIVSSYRQLGAPVVLLWFQEGLQWWKQGHQIANLVQAIPRKDMPRFFREHAQELAPHAIYRAKTWGRFESAYQLSFVDVGLMPLVESEIGSELSGLIERVVSEVKSSLRPRQMTDQLGHWLLKSAFWLLAAKILHDKAVPTFASIDMLDVDSAFASVAKHYGTTSRIVVPGQRERDALLKAAQIVKQFAHLGHVTTESLAYVYENALISKETRAKLGTHSTPSYLVEYIVWQLAPWVEQIAPDDRHVFEPACGHGAFLVSAMRLLRELLPGDIQRDSGRKQTYLRDRLHGVEIDAFAIEIARLSLTLADIPNPNGWDLQNGDMFAGDALEHGASRASILLANPPFERFAEREREEYAVQRKTPRYGTKAAEMLNRTLPYLKPGAVFGVVVPQGLLHSKGETPLRELMTKQFEIAQVCLFPDKVFTFSDMESAVIIGRKVKRRPRGTVAVHYCRVRERDAERFKRSYSVTAEREFPQTRFANDAQFNMRIPDHEDIWQWCRHYPKLEDVSEIGQGLFYKGHRALPLGSKTFATSHFAGSARGYIRLSRDLQLHEEPREFWMNLDPAVVDRKVTGATTGVPQVLLNYARVGRGPWRLKALIDREGHAVTSRFITIRPKQNDYPLEFAWALCNSPFANAYTYAHSMKRDILVGTLRAMPVPRRSGESRELIAKYVREYFDAVAENEQRPPSEVYSIRLRGLLLRIDAEILRLYELPPRLERQLLDIFAGWPRPGVPFCFDRYYPEDFEPCFPLHEYLSPEYERSTAGCLRARHKDVTSPALLAALENAAESFGE
jgi:hypothetical protein